jgi:hypothetical protein
MYTASPILPQPYKLRGPERIQQLEILSKSGMWPSMRSLARNRREAQHAALEEARRAKWDTPSLVVVQGAVQFAFTVIVNGGLDSQILQIMSFLNIVVPGKKTYYRVQSTVCQASVELATESCGRWRENLVPHSVIAMDGSCSQRRDASHCVVDFIDVASGKIVDFEILERLIGFSGGNYCHSFHGIETEGARRIVNR